MNSSDKVKELIFDESIPFEARALHTLNYQLRKVPPFRLFASQTGHAIHAAAEGRGLITGMPFLPISLFRTFKICSEDRDPVVEFQSSGTTGMANSVHRVADEGLYRESIRRCFTTFYGPPRSYVFFALLPSYLEQGHSSLVYMVRHLIDLSECADGGFYMYDHKDLMEGILGYAGPRKIVLIGVSFALWELAEKFSGSDLSGVTIMETGGMKGRRKEIIREELHSILKNAFRAPVINSEYGMTELLSQAYSSGDGRYRCPHWMKVLVRDPYDPFNVSFTGKGALNIIDLANLYSCSFIATDDVGEVYEDESFEVRGRLDGSALRGCNLMY